MDVDSIKGLLKELKGSFTINDDSNSLEKCTQLLKEFDETTAKLIKDQKLKIAEYEREVQRLNEHMKELNDPRTSKQTNDKEIKREIIKLENSVFSVAKEIGSIEFELNRIAIKLSTDLKRIDELDSEIAKVKNKFDENARNKAKNTESIQENPDLLETDELKESILLIKMKLFEQIGLKINTDLSKLIILNKSNNSLNSFDLQNENQFSDYFISNFIWDNI